MDESTYLTAPPQLPFILERTEQLGFNMASDPLTGSLLKALAASKPGSNCLELGTGTGIATAWLLAGLDSSSTLTTVDIDPRVQSVAAEAFKGDHRLTIKAEDGLAFLEKQGTESFDLVFADAMPGKFEGLDQALRVVRKGGFYIIDDLLPQPNWPPEHAEKVPLLLENLIANRQFTVATLNWATGLAIAVRN